MKKVLGCFFQKSSHGNTAVPSLAANTPPYYKQSASRLLLAVLFMLTGIQGVWGRSVTYDFTTDAGCTAIGITRPKSSSSSTDLDDKTDYTLSSITMNITHGGIYNTRVYNASGSTTLRTYHNAANGPSTLTFSSSYTITQIVFTASTFNYESDCGTLSTKTWTGSANSVTFTTTASSNAISTITITYSPPAYTVTFDKEGGRCETSSLTEESGDAGVELPSALPSVACAAQDWVFAGWAASTCSETTTAPVLYHAGSTYHPASNCTLHAVYKLVGDDITTNDTIIVNSDLNSRWNKGGRMAGTWATEYLEKTSIRLYGANSSDPAGYISTKNRFTNISSISVTAASYANNVDTLSYSCDGETWIQWSNRISVPSDVGAYSSYPFSLTSFPSGTFYLRVTCSASSHYIFSVSITSKEATFNSNPSCCTPNTITLASSGSVTGGTFSADVSNACENATVTLTATPAGGYNFTSWTITKTADGSDITSSVSLSGTTSATFTMPDYGVTVNATFTPSGYAITLDKNGGDSDGSAVAVANATAFTAGFTEPSRTGYTIEGYYLEEGCETPVADVDGNFEASVTGWTNGSSEFTKGAAGTLYTNWTAKTSTVTLDNQSATTAGEDEVTATYDAAMRSIAEDLPAKTGHTFRGYYDAVSGGGKKYYNADGSSANNWDKENAEVTLYAYWTPDTTTITLDANGGSGGTTEVLAVYGETPPAITLPTKSGYSFYEYRTGADGSGLQIITTLGNWKNSVTNYTDDGKWVYTADDETTLYAVWNPIYRVEWRVDGALYHVDSVLTGNKVASLPTPPTSLHESSDKIFAGWRSSEIDGSTDTDDTFYDVSGSPTITSDVTFYAVFGDRISTSAAAETVLWSENFSSYSADDVPSGSENTTNGNGRIVYNDGNVTYKCHDGILPTSTYVYDDSGNNQMRLGATNGIFKVGNISTAGATVAKLTYDKTLKQSVLSYLIKENGDSINIQLNSNANPAGTYSYTFNCNDFTTFAIGFKATTGNNVRLDNIVLEVERPSFEHLVTNSYHNDLSSDEESPEAMNWSEAEWAKGVVPTISDTVVLSNIAMTVDVNNAKASKVILKDNSTLTISAGKALVVKDNIRKWDGENYVATDEEDIIIGSTLGDGTGALVMGNYDGTNKATVNFAVKAGKKDGKWVNQFIGTPFNDETAVLYNYYGTQLYEFKADGSGTTTSEWTKLTGSSGMTPFMGYNLLSSQNVTSPNPNITLWMQGTLYASSVSSNKVLNGYKGAADSTENMFANSWMAPIHIDEMETTDFSNMEATIYIFNAGTPEDQGSHSTADGSADNNEPRQYIVLPIKSSTWLSETAVTVIPAMQAFSVFAKGASPSLTLDYNKLVYEPALENVGVVPTRAPKRTTEEAPEVIKLRVSAESGYAANTYLLGRSDFDEGFDNGWDGRYMEGDEEAPQLYIPSKNGNMVINCVPEIEGTVLAFRKGSKDNTYMFSFEYEGEENWYLNDTKEQSATLIAEDQTYRFESESSDNTARFVISQTPIKKTPTGVDSGGTAEIKAQKMMIDGVLYIIRAGKIYDATGVLVK